MRNQLGQAGFLSDDSRSVVVFKENGKEYRGLGDVK